ncbi:MAG: 30S ribosomal protein S13, partial [Chromatiales bacterium]
MARIAGINIPPNKHVGIALTHIFGVGRSRALRLCEASGIAPNVKVKDLSEPEIERIRAELAR